MAPICFTSIQAPNADPLCASIADYVGAHLGSEAIFTADLHWQERRHLLIEGEAQFGWVCGLPYVRAVAESPGLWLPLVAPVMVGARYRGQPVYFSDIVVRADAAFRRFSDLRGCRWTYNEPESYSGNGVVRAHLADLGEDGDYFHEVTEAGSHQVALEMILEGRVDASAIDSTVLETELRARPGLARRIRIVEVLGPSPAPLWVAHCSVPAEVRSAAQSAFLGMAGDPNGQEVLVAGAMLGFASVTDADYDPIRRMAQAGMSVVWRSGCHE